MQGQPTVLKMLSGLPLLFAIAPRNTSDEGRKNFLGWRGITSQRLQVFDNRQPFWLRQVVAEGVAGVASSGEGGVVNLAPLDSGQLGISRLVQDGDLPS